MTKTVQQTRETFIDYFKKHGHTHERSAPLLPQNDPTLLFINAGMAQFKNVFTGHETRPYTRAVTAQKCVRAGGKHNDLDNVGYTSRHHTFFEMLGNFSFGDYFKEDAIKMAWDLLTKEFGIDKAKLLITIYADDDEAHGLWKKIAGLSDDKIIRIATDDNFWKMGDTGPCGPSSEIFYDHGDHIPGGPPGTPEEDGDRFVEIWNLVFMQYNQTAAGQSTDEMSALPKPCIDTGSGLERLAAVLQGKQDNYDTDLIRALIMASSQVSGVDPDGDFKASHRVIVDHLRASAFLIADGIMPSNEGRGYVLRRIMRRAMRHAHMMGCEDPIMYKLVPSLITQMGGTYDELVKGEKLIVELLRNEEERFKATIDRGLHLLSQETEKLGAGEALSGEVAFKLFDTYGFPLDLTQDVLRGENRGVDIEGFKNAMEEQKKLARQSWSGSGDDATEEIWFDLSDKFGATEFMGYTTEASSGEVIAIVKEGKTVESLKAGETGVVLTNQTPFYGESGGQVGDVGRFMDQDGDLLVQITDTQKKNAILHAHMARVEKGALKVGQNVEMVVDSPVRADTKANHSATHLLHEALRRHFGDHVTQKGSLVTPEKFRFDFSQPGEITKEDIRAIEETVNDRIRANRAVEVQHMTRDQASEAGAMALFGEKYGDEVRVVSMGGDEKASDFSIELCGGTHVERTGDIGLFKIIGVSTIAANIKRIEAITGRAALKYMSGMEATLQNISTKLSAPLDQLEGRLEALLKDNRDLKQNLDQLRHKIATGQVGPEQDDVKDINGVKVIAKTMQDIPAKQMGSIADELIGKLKSGVVALVAVNEGKAAMLVKVSPDLTEKLNAVDLVKSGVAELGGKGGGGRPDFAQGGGPDASKADEAIRAVEKALA